MLQSTSKIWLLLGNRPEAAQQFPVYQACVERFGRESVALVGTRQSPALDRALTEFGVQLHASLESVRNPSEVLPRMTSLLAEHRPAWLIVPGDSDTSAMAAWAASLLGVPVAHHEAGLRCQELHGPRPEEVNRRLISLQATLHCAPTERARDALLREGVPAARIHVTGSPRVDVLRSTLARRKPPRVAELEHRLARKGLQPVLIHAAPSETVRWREALTRFAADHRDLCLIYPSGAAGGADETNGIEIIAPLDYAETCHLLRACRFVVTDTGELEEEAATLGIPVVICRDGTERPETVERGLGRVAGKRIPLILEAMGWASQQPSGEPRCGTLFGDGWSGRRIAELLDREGRGIIPASPGVDEERPEPDPLSGDLLRAKRRTPLQVLSQATFGG